MTGIFSLSYRKSATPRIFYTDHNLEDTFLVVDAKYPNGVFGAAVYKSDLVPAEVA
jgi:hypothetical protein